MEVTEKKTLKQLRFSCGGDWGGETVNQEFWALMERLFGAEVMEKFYYDYKSDHLEMDHEFELKKRGIEDFTDLQLTLCPNLLDLVEDMREKPLKIVLKEGNWLDLITLKGSSKLTLKASAVQSMFMPSLNKLLIATNNMLVQTSYHSVDIVMVGGFSNSKVVREIVKRKFPSHRVIEPQDAALAVLKGAVLYGHNPNMVSSRICRYTYGIEVMRPFMDSDLDEHLELKGGVRYCKHAFLRLAQIEQDMEIDTAVTIDDTEALYEDAPFMSFNIYQSTEREPIYVTDKSCVYIGKLKVESGPSKRKVKVWMRFGTSEIMVEGRDAETQELIAGSVRLDLLEPAK